MLELSNEPFLCRDLRRVGGGNLPSDIMSIVLGGNSNDGRVRKKSKTQIGQEYVASIRVTKNLPAHFVLPDDQLDKVVEHFKLLPQRYAVDVNTAGVDPLMHFCLLERAREQPQFIHFTIKTVLKLGADFEDRARAFGSKNDLLRDALPTGEQEEGPVPLIFDDPHLPAFQIGTPGSYNNLQDLDTPDGLEPRDVEYEVTFATRDGKGIMAFITSVFTKLELNQKEVHCFPVSDNYVLDVFLLNNWTGEEHGLHIALKQELEKWQPSTGRPKPEPTLEESPAPKREVPDIENSDWKLDMAELQFGHHIAKGAFGDLFYGTYHGTEVAIKQIREDAGSPQCIQEFLQEVAMMRKARHKNIVQMIGAHMGPDRKLIVFEYMSGGSVHDWIRRQPEVPLSAVMEIAIGVANGMAYLHSMNIIHRDLKAANLLIDSEHKIVKVSDFGVARIVDEINVMTSETGTYRWMAPEVISHKQYNGKADVYSFGILLWELLTQKTPYEAMTPIQAAVGVVQDNLRPPIPDGIPRRLRDLIERCWAADPEIRPTFPELLIDLRNLFAYAKGEEARAGVKSVSLSDEGSRPIPIGGSIQPGFLSKVFKGGKR